jgi:hypothetical protein
MAKYMTQKMSSGTKTATTYYRQQSAHPSHDETGRFTTDAKANYATTHGVTVDKVEVGTFKSNQGVPTGGTTVEI